MDWKRTPHLTSKAIRSTLIATILTAFAPLIATFTDGLFVGNVVGEKAFSGMSLVIPLITFSYVLAYICHMGANMMASRALGGQDRMTANRYYTVAMVSSFVVEVIVVLISLLLKSTICGALCKDPEMYQYLSDYYSLIILNLLPFSIASTQNFFVSGEGFPKHTTIAILSGTGANVVLDFVFIALLGLGVRGAALATLLSSLVTLSVHLYYVLSGKTKYRFVSTKGETKRILATNLKHGCAFNVINLSLNIFYIFANILVAKVVPVSDIFAWSVCVQINYITFSICAGIITGGVYLANNMVGEGDWTGVQIVCTSIIRNDVIFFGILLLIMSIFPGAIAIMFGADQPGVADVCRLPFICFSLFMLGFTYISTYTNVFHIMGHIAAKFRYVIMCAAATYLCMLLGSMISVRCMWYGLALGGLFSVVLSGVYAYRQHLKNPILHWYTLVPCLGEAPQVEASSTYDSSNIQLVREKFDAFLPSCELTENQILEVRQCCEEMMQNLIDTKMNKDVSNTFDIRLVDHGDKVQLIMKDSGRPFNPTFRLSEGEVPVDEKGNPNLKAIRLQLINTLSERLDYRYSYGLNSTVLTWLKEK
ncbi:MAG: ATP-binding protein [Bacteroidales bacterium]|nr:ATP-binding protein [Candidatus Colimorpha onthohippi]